MENNFFDWLINPIDSKIFYEKFWEKELLLIKRNNPNYFDDLFDIEAFDKLLSYTKIPYTNIDLAKDSTPLDKEEYCDGTEINLERLMELHNDGATIILRAIHNWYRPLQRLRLQCESTFYSPVQINVYLTPPENTSTPPHWDTHDLFVLQLKGTKNWKIFSGSYALPLSDDRFIPGVSDAGSPVNELLLEAGDIAYLPRGTVHEPQSFTYSVHAAVGILSNRWVDLLIENIRLLAKNNIELRKKVTFDYGLESESAHIKIVNKLLQYLPSINNQNIAKQAVEMLVNRFIQSRNLVVEGKLIDVINTETVSVATIVKHNIGICFRSYIENDKIYLLWAKQKIAFPVHLKTVFDFITTTDTFKVDDISRSLTEEEKVVIISTLIDSNFLTIKRYQ